MKFLQRQSKNISYAKSLTFYHYLALKKDREKLVAQKNSVVKKILSPIKAQKITENIFVGGA